MHIPNHIAIIMDGNGRWAKKHGKQRIIGHQKGAETVRTIVTECIEIGVKYLTLYAFSSENWHRPNDEVKALMALLKLYLAEELPRFQKENIRLNVIGNIARLPVDVQSLLKKNIAETAHNTGMQLNLALSYGGRDELARAMHKIAQQISSGSLKPADIDESTIETHLDTADMPDPDLLIRTSGEIRVSNFLLWQLSYSEMYFTPVLWPDFDVAALHEALDEYRSRVRRFGARQHD